MVTHHQIRMGGDRVGESRNRGRRPADLSFSSSQGHPSNPRKREDCLFEGIKGIPGF